jgi:hypothetical protein
MLDDGIERSSGFGRIVTGAYIELRYALHIGPGYHSDFFAGGLPVSVAGVSVSASAFTDSDCLLTPSSAVSNPHIRSAIDSIKYLEQTECPNHYAEGFSWFHRCTSSSLNRP